MSNIALKRAKDSLAGYNDETLTSGGVSFKTLILFLFMVPTFVWSWSQPTEVVGGYLLGSLIVGFVVALITIFSPRTAFITAPIYSILEGILLGSISKIYDAKYPGIPFEAAALTMTTFGVMWLLYSSGTIKVNEKFKQTLLAAMLGIVIYYVAAIVTPMFGFQMPLIHDSGWMGITFSIIICLVAAFNFLLDFDTINEMKGVAPKYMEWYCAFGLILTFVWLYLELMRLLSKIKD